MPGCNGLWFTADCGNSRFEVCEATEGRGEARRKLVNELGLNRLELWLLSPGHTNIYARSLLLYFSQFFLIAKKNPEIKEFGF